MKSRLMLLITCSLLVAATMAGPASAQDTVTIHLYPIGDSYLDSGHQNSNYGSSLNTYVGDRSPAGGGTCLSCYQFDLSSVPGGAEILNAELWLYGHEKYGAFQQNVTVEAHLITTPGWDEGTITYNAAPGYSTNASASVTGWFEPGWATWNVTADVAASPGGGTLIGWAVMMNPVTQGCWLNFYSREQVPMPDYRPMLEVSYIAAVPNEAASWSEVKSLYR